MVSPELPQKCFRSPLCPFDCLLDPPLSESLSVAVVGRPPVLVRFLSRRSFRCGSAPLALQTALTILRIVHSSQCPIRGFRSSASVAVAEECLSELVAREHTGKGTRLYFFVSVDLLRLLNDTNKSPRRTWTRKYVAPKGAHEMQRRSTMVPMATRVLPHRTMTLFLNHLAAICSTTAAISTARALSSGRLLSASRITPRATSPKMKRGSIGTSRRRSRSCRYARGDGPVTVVEPMFRHRVYWLVGSAKQER